MTTSPPKNSTSTSKCPTCQGRRHIPVNDAWEPCPACFAQAQTDDRLSGLPPHLRDKGLADLEPSDATVVLQKVLGRVAAKDFPRKYVLISGAKSKDALVAALLHDASLLGLAAARTSLQQLMDSYFDDKDSYKALLRPTVNILVIQLGTEILNSASAPVLRETISERMWVRGYTLLVSDTTVAAMKRDKKRFPDDVVDYLQGDEFKEVLL